MFVHIGPEKPMGEDDSKERMIDVAIGFLSAGYSRSGDMPKCMHRFFYLLRVPIHAVCFSFPKMIP